MGKAIPDAELAWGIGVLLSLLLWPAAARAEPCVTLTVGGDVLPGRGVAREAARAGNSFLPYSGIAGILRASDLALANLECPLVPGPPVALKEFRLRADPGAAGLLARAGFGLLSIANNHALDYGEEGLASTRAALAGAGIRPLDPAGEVVDVKGLRVGVLAACDLEVPPGRGHLGDVTPQALAAAVRALRARSDVVAVSLHAGREYRPEPTHSQRALARAAVEGGAALVVGHHAHVLQPAEWVTPGSPPVRRTAPPSRAICNLQSAICNRLVLHGLGNLVFDQMHRPYTRESVLVRAHLDRSGVSAAEVIPLAHRRMGRPEPVGGREGRAIAERLGLPLQSAFSRVGDDWRESFLLLPPGTRNVGRPTRRADADGDGRLEEVRVSAGRASLLRDGRVVWRSPPELRVVDACMADLRGEGRPQICLALWKRGPHGLRSCLWLYGWFRNRWNPRWCSSPLDRPILAFAPLGVAPGAPSEIAVVEGHYSSDRERIVSVWRWNGWGFTLLWRSRPGGYTRVHPVGPALLVTER